MPADEDLIKHIALAAKQTYITFATQRYKKRFKSNWDAQINWERIAKEIHKLKADPSVYVEVIFNSSISYVFANQLVSDRNKQKYKSFCILQSGCTSSTSENDHCVESLQNDLTVISNTLRRIFGNYNFEDINVQNYFKASYKSFNPIALAILTKDSPFYVNLLKEDVISKLALPSTQKSLRDLGINLSSIYTE